MKKLLFLLAVLAFASTGYAQKIKIPCPTTLNDINDCPDTQHASFAVQYSNEWGAASERSEVTHYDVDF